MRAMQKVLFAYAGTALTMLGADLLWLGLIATPLYRQGIGHLMAEQPRWAAVLLFYAVYSAGLVMFAVKPNAQRSSWRPTASTAALLGLFAYATYDLTNLATLRDWPLGLSLADIAWGCSVSALAASAGRLAMRLGLSD